MNTFQKLALVCALSALVGPIGCSGSNAVPRGIVKGRVTLAGKPLTGATIVFENKEIGVAQTAPLNDNGEYEFTSYAVNGLPTGSYKVALTSGRFMAPGEEIPKIEVAPAKGGNTPPAPKKAPVTVPNKYTKADTSGLTAEVKAGDNPPFNFDLN